MLVGELVGARLIAHAGSLLNLAKQPASTVQILGAEKALFRALKTKHEARAARDIWLLCQPHLLEKCCGRARVAGAFMLLIEGASRKSKAANW